VDAIAAALLLQGWLDEHRLPRACRPEPGAPFRGGATMSLPNPAELIRQMASTSRPPGPPWHQRAALHRHPHRRCLGGPGPAQELGSDEPLGTLDVSFYRDDFSQNGLHPQVRPSELPFEIEGQHLVLVDDVLMSGRTIRAALNELFDYGRPASVTLVCLLDLDAGELPIRPMWSAPPCRWPPMSG
jgi:pyrimidine operon attenuation protein/uracil phosphoribosyltransferase